MAKCKLCGNNAGLFSKVCSACKEKESAKLRSQLEAEQHKAMELAEAKRLQALADKKRNMTIRAVQSEFDRIVIGALVNGVDTSVIETEVNNALQRLSLDVVFSDDEIKNMLFISWDHAVEFALDDHILSEIEESRLDTIATFLGLREIEYRPVYETYKQGKLLRILSQGKLPTIRLEGILPIPLASNERLVYKFDDVHYSNIVTESHFVGGSQGVSFRICKGVSYRLGNFRGHTERSDRVNYVGSGALFVTTKSLAFVSPSVSMRIPFSKIAGFTPTSSGFVFYRTNKTAKPEQFEFWDGWFPCNLVSIVSSTHFDVRKLPPNILLES